MQLQDRIFLVSFFLTVHTSAIDIFGYIDVILHDEGSAEVERHVLRPERQNYCSLYTVTQNVGLNTHYNCLTSHKS